MTEHQPKPNEPQPIENEEVKQHERGLNIGLLVVVILLAVIVVGAAIWYFRTRSTTPHAMNPHAPFTALTTTDY